MTDFEAVRRETMDVRDYKKHKLELFECLRTHCYPLAPYMRKTPFNEVRAHLCS